MTPEQIEAERPAFEAWWISTGRDTYYLARSKSHNYYGGLIVEREWVAWLTCAEAKHQEIERLREALEWYADPISYAITQASEPRTAIHGDNGRRARAALNPSPSDQTQGADG